MGRHSRDRRAPATTRAATTALALSLGAVPLAAAPAALAAPGPVAESSRGVDGTPCTDERIRACVDLSSNRTWLLDGEGTVVRGPVANRHGGPGQETPTGDFVVQWKNADHVSGEHGSPMPYAVFFDRSGRAFHQGDLDRRSAGCVRLSEADAKAFFAHLSPNDRVQIVE